MKINLIKSILIIAISITIIAITDFVYSQGNIPDVVLCSSVYFETNVNYGSGVFVADSNNVYFLTARHCLFTNDFTFKPETGKFIFYPHNIVSGEQAIIYINLKTAFIENSIKYDKYHDIALIHIGSLRKDSTLFVDYKSFIVKNKQTLINTIYDSNMLQYSETTIGKDIILFGYPRSIGLKDIPQFDYERPLLRKGIIAGKYEKNKSIIIDSPTYSGNSGGPVYSFRSESIGVRMYLIGIVSEYIPYEDSNINKNVNEQDVLLLNTGYSIITSIDYAINLMKTF